MSLVARSCLLLVAAALGAGAAEEVPAVTTLPARFDRVVLVRLKNGTDLLDGLRQAVAREKIRNAVIVSGFGSVSAYHVHVVETGTLPVKDAFLKENAPYDLLAVTGAVLDGKVHAHLTLANPGKTTGGHLEPGTQVLTFTFVTLGVLDDKLDIRRFDDQTWH